ncbi:MAG: aryl-sulfate sulfotransferase [Pseudomonadales bacterium]|nr:aryl-sulfate sulfotransferase [Pseudomonadales bacterium]
MGWSVNRPTGLTFHKPALSTKGYTLLTPHGDSRTYLIDMSGKIVHEWTFSHIRPGYGRLLENGNLLMTGSDINMPPPAKDEPTKAPPPFEQHVTRLGGYHSTLTEVSWGGDVVWEYFNKAQHHDFFRFPNGNTMVPEWIELPDEYHKGVRGGYRKPRERLPQLLGDDLVEVDSNLKEVRRIHIWKLLDPVKDPISPTVRRWEWTHVNGIDINDAGDIVFSARHADRVAIISAESESITWKHTESHGQHNPTWVDGNIQIFDNGNDSSAIRLIDPSDDEELWNFRGSPAHQFYSGHISGASRMPSGNILVCEGTSGRLFEVTQSKEVVWEWVNPFTNNNSRGVPSVSIYRAHRYEPDHPALTDKDLDPNRYANRNRLHGLM